MSHVLDDILHPISFEIIKKMWPSRLSSELAAYGAVACMRQAQGLSRKHSLLPSPWATTERVETIRKRANGDYTQAHAFEPSGAVIKGLSRASLTHIYKS